MKETPGNNGGTLKSLEKGERLPGAGRKPNRFKEAIRMIAEGDDTFEMELSGWVLVDGQKSGSKVQVVVAVPAPLAVAIRMYKKAAGRKADVAAARWLTETGFGKTFNIEDGDGNPMNAGFVVVLPPPDPLPSENV